MRMFARVLRAELMKVRWGLCLFLSVLAPLIMIIDEKPDLEAGFAGNYESFAMVYGFLLFPILAGVFAGLVCRTDHQAGGWTRMLSLPVGRTHLYLAKYVVVTGLLAFNLAVLFGVFATWMWAYGAPVELAWRPAMEGLFLGWLAVLPLAAVQLWASSRWKAFGGPMAINVALTLPAIFAAQSETYGPWYPWAQPVLAMISPVRDSQFPVDASTLSIVVGVGFAAAMAAGLATFARADVT